MAATFWKVYCYDIIDRLLQEGVEGVGDVFPLENLAAVCINRLTLTVHDIVILEDVLTNLGVTSLDLALSRCDCARDHLRLDCRVIWDG